MNFKLEVIGVRFYFSKYIVTILIAVDFQNSEILFEQDSVDSISVCTDGTDQLYLHVNLRNLDAFSTYSTLHVNYESSSRSLS